MNLIKYIVIVLLSLLSLPSLAATTTYHPHVYCGSSYNFMMAQIELDNILDNMSPNDGSISAPAIMVDPSTGNNGFAICVTFTPNKTA